MAHTRIQARQRSASSRAFTLVELMVVVTIVGVLAAIGITLFRKHVDSGRAIEALNMIQAIRGGQERWRAETQRYMRASSTTTAYYPNATPGRDIDPWDNSGHADYANWQRLNIASVTSVRGVYTTVAGNAGSSPNSENLSMFSGTIPTFGAQNQPWYLIHAMTNLDDDSEVGVYLATSLNGEVYVENEGE